MKIAFRVGDDIANDGRAGTKRIGVGRRLHAVFLPREKCDAQLSFDGADRMRERRLGEV